jgi:uncharacterized protein
MTRNEYQAIEAYMLRQMRDSAHDKHHIYRVLYAAADIAQHEQGVDFDVLTAACLLHDVGREAQYADLENLCHAQIGGPMAYDFLISLGWDEAKARHVSACVSSHRYRGDNPPASIEAKILFDADKLEAAGALGIARTLIYNGEINEPFYLLDDDNQIVTDGGGGEISSFFQEYNFKLKKIYEAFYTRRAKEMAQQRQQAAVDFYHSLYDEIASLYLTSIPLYTD